MATTGTSGAEYRVRRYDAADRDAVLGLYERILDTPSGPWFDWKFRDNPYAERVPIFVVERDGEVVGARPNFPLGVSVGGEPETAVLQVGAMVHPDHRRRGLFTRMVTDVYDHYAERDPVTSIGFPNDDAKAALLALDAKLSLDHSVVETFPTYYRVQNPSSMLGANGDGGSLGTLARLATPAARGYLGTRDALARSSGDFDVRQHDEIPVEQLASLAETHRPAGVHARRDEEFYRWRFDYPAYDYTAYTASRGGSLVAGVVVGTRTRRGTTVANLTDVLPLTGCEKRDAALAQLLARVVTDYRDSDLVVAAGRTLPDRLLRTFGFHANTGFPLSAVATTDNFIGRPLTNDSLAEWRVNGRDLSNPDNWMLSLFEHEIA